MPPTQPSGPLRVLVVEDNPINQRLVNAFLAEAGHEAVLVSGGREALGVLEEESFDLILMDVQMPDMDGFEATAEIRAREASAGGVRHPIVAMTAHITKEDRDRCLAAGMDGHIGKPMRYEELIELVERLALRKPALRKPAPRPAPAPPAAGIGRAGVRPELVAQFVDDAVRLHEEMREAIARQDGAALRRAAHSLCGTAGFFKVHSVCDLARRLETLGKAGDLGAETERVSRELGDELARLRG